MIAGPRGFLRGENPTMFVASPYFRLPSDPAELRADSFIGTTGIVLETRDRQRLNGRIASNTSAELRISVEQVFGGCPKYIQGMILASDFQSRHGYMNNSESSASRVNL